MALIFLIFIVVYLFFTIVVVSISSSVAGSCNRSPWLWGSISLILMYNLVFWDYIPTKIVHNHLCSTKSGLIVHQAPDQWYSQYVSEFNNNPPSLNDNSLGRGTPVSVTDNNSRLIQGYSINNRIIDVIEIGIPVYHIIPIRKNVYYIYDKKTQSRLVELVNYTIGYSGQGDTNAGISAWKIWMSGSCFKAGSDIRKTSGYSEYYDKLIEIGDSK